MATNRYESTTAWARTVSLSLALGDFNGAVIVAMTIVRVMQMTIYKIIDVITMRYWIVSTTGSMDMMFAVTTAPMAASTRVRILLAYLDLMFGHFTIRVLMLKSTILQIVNMVPVMDWCVSAGVSVNMYRMVPPAKHTSP